ncbi:MAG TPA: peptide chain release factor N(5)-glutamine methyltransferase, partial [Pseudomonadales bacterium]
MATTIAEFLRTAGDGPSRRDIEVLLAAALGVQRTYLYAHGEQPLTGSSAQAAYDMLRRLRAGTPVAYIVGRREFRDLLLEVSSHVLIPRPETELLVELALQRLAPSGRVLDLGTGSGAVALAIKQVRSDCAVTATDISEQALVIARRNASTHALAIDWRIGNWYSAVDGVFDTIVANPPYIAESDPHLDALVGEPRLALVAGVDGLDALRNIIDGAPHRLADEGWLLVEHGFDQGYA